MHGLPSKKIIYFNSEQQEIQWKPQKQNSFRNFFNRNPLLDIKSLPLRDIREVCKGVHTDILKNAGLIDPLTCMSIVTDYRTLDMSFVTSKHRDAAMNALQKILMDCQYNDVIYN